MASLLTHGVAALGIGACLLERGTPRRIWIAGMLCAMVPDLDVIGFGMRIRYGDFWGHRGFTHSILFAALLAAAIALVIPPRTRGETPHSDAVQNGERWNIAQRGLLLWAYLFLATASHGLLDAMTNGGLGVAFFSPFDNTRYFLPWRPLVVSPIGVSKFFGERGLAVLRTEFLWVWIPTALLATMVLGLRRRISQVAGECYLSGYDGRNQRIPFAGWAGGSQVMT